MKNNKTIRIINSTSMLLGVICLLVAAGASDADHLDITGLAISLSAGVLLLMIGAGGIKLSAIALFVSRAFIRLVYQCLCPADGSPRVKKTLARSGYFEVSVENTATECYKNARPAGDERLYSKCS